MKRNRDIALQYYIAQDSKRVKYSYINELSEYQRKIYWIDLLHDELGNDIIKYPFNYKINSYWMKYYDKDPVLKAEFNKYKSINNPTITDAKRFIWNFTFNQLYAIGI